MNLWERICEQLESGNNVCLLTVIDSKGSAPGKSGFKMVVSEDGQLWGSVGGGIMEFNLVEKSRKKLFHHDYKAEIINQVHRPDNENSSGMICSGSQIVAMNFFQRDDCKNIRKCINEARLIELNSSGLFIRNNELDDLSNIVSDKEWRYLEYINRPLRIHIFGAGHVSVPTSELLMRIGFEVYLYDNRKDINTFYENSNVTCKSVINYEETGSIPINVSDYVLLMTHKFTDDLLLLSRLIDTSCRYLGVLGSKSKIRTLFKELKKNGADQKKLKRIHAPVGMQIQSETPQEIAVSIVAEIIGIKNS